MFCAPCIGLCLYTTLVSHDDISIYVPLVILTIARTSFTILPIVTVCQNQDIRKNFY